MILFGILILMMITLKYMKTDVFFGYDLTCNKQLDCNDYNTSSNLYKSLVEIRRCRFDVIISILKGKILIDDSDRLFHFMSFILNTKITDDNYKDYLLIARNYILSKYPNLEDIDIKEDIELIKNNSKEYSINHFYFNRIDKNIDNLKYIKNNEKVIKIQR